MRVEGAFQKKSLFCFNFLYIVRMFCIPGLSFFCKYDKRDLFLLVFL